MPSHSNSLSDDQVIQAANFVLSLSGEKVNTDLAIKGKKIFNTKGCSGCHTPSAIGMKELGSANLTDKIWTQANVPSKPTIEEKIEVVKEVIRNGFQRKMPSWETELSSEEITILAYYVKAYLGKEKLPTPSNKLKNDISLLLEMKNRSVLSMHSIKAIELTFMGLEKYF